MVFGRLDFELKLQLANELVLYFRILKKFFHIEHMYSELRDIKTDETRCQKPDQDVSAKKILSPTGMCYEF